MTVDDGNVGLTSRTIADLETTELDSKQAHINMPLHRFETDSSIRLGMVCHRIAKYNRYRPQYKPATSRQPRYLLNSQISPTSDILDSNLVLRS